MKRRVPFLAMIFILSIFSFTNCSEAEKEYDCNMSGTIRVFGTDKIFSGLPYIVYVDVDTDPYNGNHVKSFEGIYVEGELHYAINIRDVEEGFYYVYMMMDISKGLVNVGFYGADPISGETPPSPNVYLKCRTVLDWEIYYKSLEG
ncbi:MAG: hypothetical protein RQ743_05255 [Bacteroidales bacterium]|nr:hypothetical protein [Bacteroidales bacterium]